MNAGRRDLASEHAAHEQWDELAVGYALSALEPEELDRFVQHLVTHCSQCSQSVADTDAVGAGLAAALPVPEARAELRADVLSAALAARPAVPQTTADALPAESSGPEAISTHRADELTVRRARRRMPARAGWILAAAAAVVALVMSVTTFAALRARDDQRSVAGARQQVISAITVGGSARVIELRADGGKMVAAVVAHKDNVTVVPDGMSVNSATTSYVLWGIASATSAPVALGMFDVKNSHLQAVPVGSDSRGYSAFITFAISHEPGRSLPASPSQVIASGQA